MSDLLGGYGESFPLDIVADKMVSLLTEEKPKSESGRPIAIDDGRLLGARDHLGWLFEQTWADVGGRLLWIRKPAEVLETLQVWNNPNTCYNQHYIAKSLLRPSSVPANSKWLASIRRQLSELNVAVRDASDDRDKCRQSFEKAERALSDNLSATDKLAVEDQISRRRQKLAHAEKGYEAESMCQKETQDLLLDGEATFARSEFVRFCTSNRYRVTPLNIANALAGLPYIGWRQSANRCKKHPAPGLNGQSIQVFKTIDRIVRSNVRRSDLLAHAERWLRSQKDKNSLGISVLHEKWYYLRWAIKTVLEADPRVQTRDLQFAVAREYWKRVGRPSNVDQLFEEEERIVN
jgi:hypothetical protein